MRKTFLLASILAASLCACGDAPPQNVLLVVVSGLRADALSPSLGAPDVPNLRALAADGASFSSCFTHTSATAPAVATLFTARTPSKNHVRRTGADLDPDVAVIAEHLNERGWVTHGSIACADLASTATGAVDRGFDAFGGSEGDVVRTDAIERGTIAFLANADPKKSWFALVQYSDPNEPWEARGGASSALEVVVDGLVVDRVPTSEATTWKHELVLEPGAHEIVLRSSDPFVVKRFACTLDGVAVEPRVTAGVLGESTGGLHLSIECDGSKTVTCSFDAFVHDAPSLAVVRARYKREVEAVDRSLGKLVALLKETGAYEQTCIVVIGANGLALGEHGIVGDGASLYDEVLRVPFVLKPPANFERNDELSRAAREIARHIDVAPTILDLVDEGVLEGAEGSTLLERAERPLVAEVHAPDAPSTFCARRDERYKLVYDRARDRFEMFDLRSDTLEIENVFELQGHFRSQWQVELRSLAENAPVTAMAEPPVDER